MKQPELPLLYVMRPPRGMPEPKVEPHRTELDAAYSVVMSAARQAVETPSPVNLRTLNDAVLKMHQSLNTLKFVEKDVAAS